MVNAFYTEEAMVVASTLVGSLLSQADAELAREDAEAECLAGDFAAEIDIEDSEQDPYELGLAYDPKDPRFDMDWDQKQVWWRVTKQSVAVYNREVVCCDK